MQRGLVYIMLIIQETISLHFLAYAILTLVRYSLITWMK